MHNRLRLLRLFTGVLYFGPLLAGLAGQGWAMVPAFVGIFLLWSVILYPQMWPHSRADLALHEAAVALAALIMTQALLVVGLFAVGRGIGGVLALQPALPDVLPVALSLVAVPLARLVWNPRVAAAQAGFDPVLQVAAPTHRKGDATEMVAHLMALGDEVTEDVVQQHLSSISDHIDPVLIRQVLGDAVAGGRASRAGVKALIVHGTDPAISNLMSGSAYPAQAFAAAGRDAELLTLFARRCVMALGDEPDLAADCPGVAAIARAAQQVGDPARTALNRLAGMMAQGGPP